MKNSHPTSMIIIEKPFSLFVFGLEKEKILEDKKEFSIEYSANLTLPKPTDVKEEKVK
jgi:hypothetical protein